MVWAAVADTIPLYPLYALLFARAGLSERAVAALFVVWSATSVLTEVAAGALADRFSRRGALVAADVLQAAAYALWLTVPTFAGFAAGFVLWGLGDSCAGAASRALLYDGLAAMGAPERFGPALGRMEAAGFAVQIPTAGVATALAWWGGITAAGVVSVGVCLVAAAVAATLPDLRPAAGDAEDDGAAPGPGTLRAAARSAPIAAAAVAVATLTALAVMEEFTPLMAADWGVTTALVPPALLAIPLAGAAGSAWGGRAGAIGALRLAVLLAAAAAAFVAALVAAHPAGVVGLAAAYGIWQYATVAAEVRLQAAITGPARATVTAAAGTAAELASIAMLALWAAAGAWGAAACAAAAAALVPALLAAAAPARPASAPAGGGARRDGA